VFTQDPCALLNSQSIPISGPLSSCVSGGIGLQIGAGMRSIMTDVVSTVFTTVQNALNASPCQILNGFSFSLSGQIANCLPPISLSFGVGFRGLIESSIQTAIDTLVSAIENPCNQIQLVGLNPCGLNINLPNTNSLLDNMLNSECIVDKILDFLGKNQSSIVCKVLEVPMEEGAKGCFLDFVRQNQSDIICAIMETPTQEGVSECLLDFVNYFKCEIFNKFIPESEPVDPCIKDSILNFVKDNKCDILNKFNEVGAASFSDLCQPEFNLLINSILCGYLEDFDDQGLVGGGFDFETGSGSFGVSPKGCALQSANKIIEEYSKLFWVVVNGQSVQVRIPTEMKIDFVNLTVEPQYYDKEGNKI
jgi:hypothetical protein